MLVARPAAVVVESCRASAEAEVVEARAAEVEEASLAAVEASASSSSS